MVYKEASLGEQKTADGRPMITVSVGEKPGVQALGVTAPDRSPVSGKHPAVPQDPEYVRMGTLSILAALDLQDGPVSAQVHERHRRKEFVELLEELDRFYPQWALIRVLLDNHISWETLAYLATQPNRFVSVQSPKHGSSLNLFEILFRKMSRTFLRHIRVATRGELKERILAGAQKINATPTIHCWENFDAPNELKMYMFD